MMNGTTKKYNWKNAYTIQVCHTLRLRGSWNLVTLTSRVGEGGGDKGEKQKNIFSGVILLGRYSLGRACPIGIAPMQDFKNFHMPWWDSYSYIQSYSVILLPKYFISFFSK